MNKSHPLYGSLLILCAVICSIICYIAVEKAFLETPSLNALNAMFWGFLGSVIFTTPFVILNKKFQKSAKQELHAHGKLLLTISILTSIGAVMWAWSLQEASAGTVGLIGKSDTILTLIVGAALLNEKFSKLSIIAATIIIIGVLLISSIPNELSLLVALVVILMRSLYVAQSYLVKKSGTKLRGLPFTYWRVLFMTTLMFIATIISGNLKLPSTNILILLITAQLFGAFLGRACYFEAHKYLGIGRINLLYLSQPVLLLAGTWFLLDESMPTKKIIGAAIVTIGLSLIVLEKYQFEKKLSLSKIFAKLRPKKDDIEDSTNFS